MRSTSSADGEILGTTLLFAVIIALLAAILSATIAVQVPIGREAQMRAQNAVVAVPHRLG